jgi:hypothetical protein
MEKIKQLWLIGIVIAIIIGSGLRFYELEKRGLWSDELYSVGLANTVGKNNSTFLPQFKHPSLLTLEDNFWTWKLTDPHPPLNDVFLAGWVKIAGTSDFAVRLPSVLFGIFLLIYSFFRLRKILPIETLFYYIVWISLSLILIRYAQEARPYSLTALLAGMLTVEFTHLFLRNPKNLAPVSWQFIVIALILSYSHFYGLLLAGIFSLWISLNVLWQRNYKEFLKFILLGIGIVPLILFVIHVKQYLVTLRPLDQMFNFDKMFFASLSQTFENVLPELGFVALLIVFIGLFYVVKNQTQNTTTYLSFTLLSITLLFVLLMTIGMQGKGAWIDRYFIAAIPPLALSLSILLTEIEIKQIYKIIILLFLLAFPLYKTWGNNYQINEQYREAAQFIGAQITEKDFLLMTGKPNLLYYIHYLKPFGRIQANNKTIPFSDDDITPANCQLLKSQLQVGTKLFLFYHGSHKNSIKKLFTTCQFSENKAVEKKFHYIGVTIYQE